MVARTQHHRPDLDRCLKHLMILALISALAYLINRMVIIPKPNSPVFFRDYLGDVLALPVYVPLSFFLAVKLEVIPGDFQLNFTHVIFTVLLFSLIFEGLIPVVDKTSLL